MRLDKLSPEWWIQPFQGPVLTLDVKKLFQVSQEEKLKVPSTT